MSAAAMGVILCLALLILWFGIRREDRLALQAACRHEWRTAKLTHHGTDYWRYCPLCGKQEVEHRPHVRD
jgi:hypothetical protein